MSGDWKLFTNMSHTPEVESTFIWMISFHFILIVNLKLKLTAQCNWSVIALPVHLLPSSLPVASVSSCKSWSTHGLKPAADPPLSFPGEVGVVSVCRDFTSKKPIPKHRITARKGVRTDRRAMTCRSGEKRTPSLSWRYETLWESELKSKVYNQFVELVHGLVWSTGVAKVWRWEPGQTDSQGSQLLGNMPVIQDQVRITAVSTHLYITHIGTHTQSIYLNK